MFQGEIGRFLRRSPTRSELALGSRGSSQEPLPKTRSSNSRKPRHRHPAAAKHPCATDLAGNTLHRGTLRPIEICHADILFLSWLFTTRQTHQSRLWRRVLSGRIARNAAGRDVCLTPVSASRAVGSNVQRAVVIPFVKMAQGVGDQAVRPDLPFLEAAEERAATRAGSPLHHAAV